MVLERALTCKDMPISGGLGLILMGHVCGGQGRKLVSQVRWKSKSHILHSVRACNAWKAHKVNKREMHPLKYTCVLTNAQVREQKNYSPEICWLKVHTYTYGWNSHYFLGTINRKLKVQFSHAGWKHPKGFGRCKHKVSLMKCIVK